MNFPRSTCRPGCGKLISAVCKNSKSGSVGSGSRIGNIAEELDKFLFFYAKI